MILVWNIIIPATPNIDYVSFSKRVRESESGSTSFGTYCIFQALFRSSYIGERCKKASENKMAY